MKIPDITDILIQIAKQSEEPFSVVADELQMPATPEAFQKLLSLDSNSVIWKLNESGEVVSWIAVVPTSQNLAEKFLNGNITERQLFCMTEYTETYEALYLCAAYTHPEHRRFGYVSEMFKESLSKIRSVIDAQLFAWPITSDGEYLTQNFSRMIQKEIHMRK